MSIIADLPIATRRSSDLSKHSAEVFAEVERHPITITRRDGEPLVLMSKAEAIARSQLTQFAGQLLTIALDGDGSLAQRMAKAFPWMLALSPAAQETCAQELVDAARAAIATDQPRLVALELIAWRETAVAIAAGLGNEPVDWLDAAVPAERP